MERPNKYPDLLDVRHKSFLASAPSTGSRSGAWPVGATQRCYSDRSFIKNDSGHGSCWDKATSDGTWGPRERNPPEGYPRQLLTSNKSNWVQKKPVGNFYCPPIPRVTERLFDIRHPGSLWERLVLMDQYKVSVAIGSFSVLTHFSA